MTIDEFIDNNSKIDKFRTFKLSNGVTFPFRCGWETNDNLVTRITKKHMDSMASSNKKHLLLLYGNKNKDSLIFADFDEPSMNFGFSSYDELKDCLTKKLGNDAVVFFSASRKVKAAFAIQGEISVPEAQCFLKSVLPDFYAHLDHSPSAITCTFLKTEAARVLSNSLGNIKIHILNRQPVEAESRNSHTWKIYNRSIDEFSRQNRLNRSETFVLRFIFGSAYRSIFLSGLQLPIRYIAETFNNEVSFQAISKAIKTLNQKGLLHLVSGSYQIRKKAKSYRVAGAALEFSRQIINELETWQPPAPSSLRQERLLSLLSGQGRNGYEQGIEVGKRGGGVESPPASSL